MLGEHYEFLDITHRLHNPRILYDLYNPYLPFLKIGKTEEKGTMINQDILGLCEPGTSIDLDGIVCNETKGGKVQNKV